MIAPPRSLLPILAALLALSGTAGSAPTLTLDLAAPPPGAKVTRVFGHGSDNDGNLGVPVCGGHDCDGDGHRDFAFAQFRGDPLGRTGAGEVTVIFGDGTIGGTRDSAIVNADMLFIAGSQVGETAGAEAWIDDVTGSGLGDLLIGRQNHSLGVAPFVRPGCGSLTILVGDPGWRTHAATLTPLDLGAPPAGLRLINFVGPNEYDRLGIWFRTGDITGDGIADILVGADEVDGEGEDVTHNQGAVFVIRGGDHLLDAPATVDLALLGSPEFPASLRGHVARIDPPAGSANYHFGATVQVADLDGNGRAEVLIAAALTRSGAGVRLLSAPPGTGSSFGGTPDGTVYIVWDENFPPGLWPEDHRFEVTSPPLGDFTAIDGESTGQPQAFGEEMVGGFDFSGDGFPDLMVGDLVADPMSRGNAGRAYVFYNVANLRGLSFDLDSPPAGLFVSRMDGAVSGAIAGDTALLGDFDGDGIGDLGIGSPHDEPPGRPDAGSLHVLYGQAGGWPANIDFLPANLPPPEVMRIVRVQGANGTSGSDRGDVLCYSAAAGDIDGNGRVDLIVNEMGGNAAAGVPQDVGNLLVIDSASLLDPFVPSLTTSVAGPVEFGAVQVLSGASFRTITFTNPTAAPVGIDSLELTGPAASEFSITSDSGESVLGTNAGRTVTVRFDPSREGRWGAALALQTSADPHPVAIGLAGTGVHGALLDPVASFSLAGRDAVMSVESQLGVNYSLLRDPNLDDGSPTVLKTVPGTGRTLHFTDSGALDLFERAFYRVRAER